MSPEKEKQTTNADLITVPEGLMPDANERGLEAGKVHESVSTNLAQKAIAEARILKGQEDLARVSAVAVKAAEASRTNANVE